MPDIVVNTDEVAAKAAPETLVSLANRAILYTLSRIQVDPDLRWHCGYGSEVFARLCEYEAALTGEDVEAVRSRRSQDLQPKHSRREPEILELRAKVESLERATQPVTAPVESPPESQEDTDKRPVNFKFIWGSNA